MQEGMSYSACTPLPRLDLQELAHALLPGDLLPAVLPANASALVEDLLSAEAPHLPGNRLNTQTSL